MALSPATAVNRKLAPLPLSPGGSPSTTNANRCWPAGSTPVLFAEGPTAHWALPLPEPVAGAPAGQQRFAFVVDGLPPGESGKGASLRLTAVAGDKAIEAGYRLD